jgi:diaminopimelate epimerase
MNGLGNDFIIFDVMDNDASLPDDISQNIWRNIADRDNPATKGCDQILILRPAYEQGDCFMDIRNADGSRAESCGNGTRAVAAYIAKHKGQNNPVIETLGGSLSCAVMSENSVEVTMPAPKFAWTDIPVAEEIKTNGVKLHDELPPAFLVNVGNPHAVFFASKKTKWMASKYGSDLEMHPLFPQQANINFAQILRDFERATILLHTWERGAGLTKACGTGACATAIAAIELGATRLPDGTLRTEVDIIPPVNQDRN